VEGLWKKRNGRSRKYEQEKAMKLEDVLQISLNLSVKGCNH